MDDKIKEFPIDKASTSDEVLWKCNACGHKELFE